MGDRIAGAGPRLKRLFRRRRETVPRQAKMPAEAAPPKKVNDWFIKYGVPHFCVHSDKTEGALEQSVPALIAVRLPEEISKDLKTEESGFQCYKRFDA
jgi:hypothetical protein